MNRRELIELPKVELHVHLDGSLPLSFVEKCLGRKVALEELQVSPDCTNLMEYLAKFDIPIRILHDRESLRESAKSVLVSLRDENVIYVEVRFAPLHHINEEFSAREAIEAALEGLEEAKELTGIEYGLIVCCMRHHSQEDNLALVEVAGDFLNKGVVAIDLAGGEEEGYLKDHMKVVNRAKEIGFPLTLHAGECGSFENVRDCVLNGAKRIGHGIAISGHEDVKALVKERKVSLEVCPISNIQTKAVADSKDYPIREFLDEGILVTINTDNRTVSGTSLSREYQWLKDHHGVTDEEIKKMIRDALEASFAKEEVKEKIRKLLK